jgi:hypothetical protein
VVEGYRPIKSFSANDPKTPTMLTGTTINVVRGDKSDPGAFAAAPLALSRCPPPSPQKPPPQIVTP